MTHDEVPSPDTVFEQIDCLAGRERRVTPLPGGLTNHNYRVQTDDVDVVVRLSPPSTGLLAVDRDHEYANSVAAAAVGIGAPVVDYLPGRGVLVVGFIPDATTYDDALVGAHLDRVGAAIAQLHRAEPFGNRFDMFAIQERYLGIMTDRGYRLPDGYVELLPYADRARAALAARPEPLVSCHNDLLAANFLDDGERMWIVDYEYSGLNEPSFELGNVIQEAHLTRAHLEELVSAYGGQPDPVRTARAELWGIISAYAWTLWGTIQAGASDLDFDFWGWAMDKYERAQSAFATSHFDDLLDEVGGR